MTFAPWMIPEYVPSEIVSDLAVSMLTVPEPFKVVTDESWKKFCVPVPARTLTLAEPEKLVVPEPLRPVERVVVPAVSVKSKVASLVT